MIFINKHVNKSACNKIPLLLRKALCVKGNSSLKMVPGYIFWVGKSVLKVVPSTILLVGQSIVTQRSCQR